VFTIDTEINNHCVVMSTAASSKPAAALSPDPEPVASYGRVASMVHRNVKGEMTMQMSEILVKSCS